MVEASKIVFEKPGRHSDWGTYILLKIFRFLNVREMGLKVECALKVWLYYNIETYKKALPNTKPKFKHFDTNGSKRGS